MTSRQTAPVGMKIILDIMYDIFYTKTNLSDTDLEQTVMSFREKSAWISLVTTVGVWGTYFWIIGRALLERGSLNGMSVSTVGLFVGGVVVIVVIQIILAIVMAIVSGKHAETPMDERERLIDLKAARAGFYALNAAVFCVSSLWLLGASPLVMANGMLLSMVIAEVFHSGGKIVGYRRGV